MDKDKSAYCWIKVYDAGGGPPAEPGPRYRPVPPKRLGTTSDKKDKVYWDLDVDFMGANSADARLDYAAVNGDRDDAINWISGADGQAWLKGASFYVLLRLGDNGNVDPTQKPKHLKDWEKNLDPGAFPADPAPECRAIKYLEPSQKVRAKEIYKRAGWTWDTAGLSERACDQLDGCGRDAEPDRTA